MRFSFVHYLSVLSAWEVNNPDRIYFHYTQEPAGVWWEKAKPYLTLQKISAPQHIFGNSLQHAAHKADVIRLEQLIATGGIYLDLDVVCVNPFAPLLSQDCVLGAQPGAGLCNAVILARPNSEFLRIWYDHYHNFNGELWDEHSVKLPLRLARENASLITIENEYSFFYPTYKDPDHVLWTQTRNLDLPTQKKIAKKIGKKITRKLTAKAAKPIYPPVGHYLHGQNWHFEQLKKSFCVHLWQRFWWDIHLADLSPDTIMRADNNFSRLMRHALGHTKVARLLGVA